MCFLLIALDDFDDVYLPAEQVVGALLLELGDCRHRCSVANYGIDKAIDGGVGVIYPLGKATVEGILLGAVKATW